ncbi:MAG: ankyrin repeat domain-containing protein [Pseudomonadales bacterium]|nr:ankyrin repeat domain-containing protein [Pseudomonadales bacterium]
MTQNMAHINALLLAIALVWASHSLAQVPDAAKTALRLGQFSNAEQLLRAAADHGNAEAAYELGRLYARELVSGKDERDAVELFRHAANENVASASDLLNKVISRHPDLADSSERWLSAEPPEQRSSSPTTIVSECAFDEFRRLELASNQIAQLLHRTMRCPKPVQWLEHAKSSGVKLEHVTDHQDNTLLHSAVAQSNKPAVKFLISQGLASDRKNLNDWTPAMLAARSNDPAIANLLGLNISIEATATVAAIEQLATSSRFEGWSNLAIAASIGRESIVDSLLSANSFAVDRTGITALVRAIDANQVHIANMLIQAGHPVHLPEIQAVTQHGDVALLKLIAATKLQAKERNALTCYIATTELQDILSLILQSAVPPEHCNGVPFGIVLTKFSGYDETITYLQGRPDTFEYRDKQGCSALCWSIKRERQDLTRTLIALGANNSASNEGTSTLMLAAAYGDGGAAQALVEKGADVSAQSNTLTQAIHLAATNGHVDVVVYLLANGADINSMDVNGDTPLLLAVKNSHLSTSAKLLALGAKAHANNRKFENAFSIAQKKGSEWHILFSEASSIWSFLGGR